jgi:ubiquinone/menaquinone biosynthesis C-methylase UbiE
MSKFDDAALNWDNKPMRVERAKTIANKILKYFNNKTFETGMDYGCGTGLLGFFLRDIFIKLYMVDTSEVMLDVLKNKIKSSQISNMFVTKLDLLKNSFDDKIDVLFNLMVLHHIENINKILFEWSNILKKNGYLIIADLEKEDGSYHADGNTIHNGIDSEQLVKNLKIIGFSNIYKDIGYTVRKEVNGKIRNYPIFLVIARK